MGYVSFPIYKPRILEMPNHMGSYLVGDIRKTILGELALERWVDFARKEYLGGGGSEALSWRSTRQGQHIVRDEGSMG